MPHKTPALLLATVAICACGDRGYPPVTELTIDTLADGSIRVANPLHGLWDANPGMRWRLVESLRIGTATAGGPDAFGNATSVTLDEMGRLWIVDYPGQRGEGLRRRRAVRANHRRPWRGTRRVHRDRPRASRAERPRCGLRTIVSNATKSSTPPARGSGDNDGSPGSAADGEADFFSRMTGSRIRTDTFTGSTGGVPLAAWSLTAGSSSCRKSRRTRP